MRRASDAETASRDRCFTLFPNLPAEIRLMIWEAALPEEVHPRSKICEIWDLKRGEDIIATTPRATANIAFLACCHESRHFAINDGSLVPLKSLVSGKAWQKKVWIDRNVEIVFIPFEPRYLDRIITIPPNIKVLADTIGNTYDPMREDTVGKYITKWRNGGTIDIDTLYFGLVDELPSITTLHIPIAALTCGRITDLPTNIKAVACMVPTPQALRALQKCLTHDLEYKGIKKVYLGIAGIPIQYSKGDDPDSYPCTESESAVVPLDGKKLITYLESAYKTHVLEAVGDRVMFEEGFHHKSALRFKNSLEKE
ncbi:hypothetical protein CEK26_003143 [Fusarium fujikuroi]|nr:hypothetical protein CEK27_003138 [Fusarium fujikuroi]QGJ01699.1 hypothetical protein CEK26_003143 [Fusarium fujikuroi]